MSKTQKRGEDLKKFYELEKDEESKKENDEDDDESIEDPTNAVEDGNDSDTTSGSDISDEEDIVMEAEAEEPKEKIEVGDPSSRLAIVNCDWDKLKVVATFFNFKGY